MEKISLNDATLSSKSQPPKPILIEFDKRSEQGLPSDTTPALQDATKPPPTLSVTSIVERSLPPPKVSAHDHHLGASVEHVEATP
jgi:hypothetical protein